MAPTRNSPWDNLRRPRSAVHRAVRTDILILVVLLLGLGLTWSFPFARGVCVGGLLMCVPKLRGDLPAWVDLETVWARYGPPPRRIPKHSGAHPRPGARNHG